jgi:hypothetical protein
MKALEGKKAENFIGLAIDMCQGDFAQELTATIALVNKQLDGGQ